MSMESLALQQALLEGIAKFVFPSDSDASLVVSLHGSVLKMGLSLVSYIARLEALGSDIVRKDKKCALLTSVINSCGKFQEAVDALKRTIRKHEAEVFQAERQAATDAAVAAANAVPDVPETTPAPDAVDSADVTMATAMDRDHQDKDLDLEECCTALALWDEEKGDVDAEVDQDKVKSEAREDQGGQNIGPSFAQKLAEAREDLFCLDSHTSFEPLLSSTLILDGISQHCVAHGERLKTATKSLVPVVAKVTLENSWKKDFTRETTLEQILKKGVESLIRLEVKGQALKALVETLHQDGLTG